MNESSFLRSRWALLAVVASVPLVRFLWDLSHGFDHLMYQFLADDAFYYFELSRHLPEFNIGIPTSGFHPIYAVLVSPLHRSLPYEYAVPASLLLLVVANCLCVVALHRLLSAYWSEPIPLLCAAAWGLNGKMYSLAMTGVETVLATLGVLLFLVQFSRLDGDQFDRAPASRFAGVGAVLGLTFLTRMDSPVLLAPFAMLLAGRALARRRYSVVALMSVSVLVLVLPWLAFMWMKTGSLFPTSGAALRVLRGLDGMILAAPEIIWRSVGQFMQHFKDFLVTTPESFRTPVLAAFVLAAVGGVVLGRSRKPSEPGEQRLHQFNAALLAGLICWSSYYVLFQGGFRRWYFAYLGIGVFGLLFPLALSVVFRFRRVVRSPLAVSSALVLATAAMVRPEPTGPQEYDKFRSALAADPILREERSGKQVAAFNAGIYNYFMSQDVINLDGTVNPGALRALREDTLAEYIREMNIGYLIEHDLHRETMLDRIARDDDLRLQRWIDLRQFYPGYRGVYIKRTYLWKIEARQVPSGYIDGGD